MRKMIEKEIINILVNKKMHISCCESCTGGMIISTLINVPGASNVINESYVTYSVESKIKILGVKKETIDKYGVASINVSKEMANGLKKISNSGVCISVTGYAGGNKKDINDGLCFYTIIVNDEEISESVKVEGSRNVVRRRQTDYILNRLLDLIK